MTNLNLASRPFTNRLVPWLLIVFVLFVSVIGLLIVVRYTVQARKQSTAIQADINNLRAQEQGLINNAKQVRGAMTPEQLQALEGAHQLVDRKGFSWSQLLADLEAALPGNVRVSRIAVRDVSKQDDQTLADLELAVLAKTSKSITDMISEMDRGGIFRAELRAQTLQKGRGETGTEYELFVVYRPRAGFPRQDLASLQDSVPGSEELK